MYSKIYMYSKILKYIYICILKLRPAQHNYLLPFCSSHSKQPADILLTTAPNYQSIQVWQITRPTFLSLENVSFHSTSAKANSSIYSFKK